MWVVGTQSVGLWGARWAHWEEEEEAVSGRDGVHPPLDVVPLPSCARNTAVKGACLPRYYLHRRGVHNDAPNLLCPSLQVRYNRKRLKGGKGDEDCTYALTSLFYVLLNVCKVRGGVGLG